MCKLIDEELYKVMQNVGTS